MPTLMSDDFFQRRVGTVLCGKWTLERLLGVGGMAAVYEARHHIGRRDAIKVLHPSAGRSAELRARFEQEARAVARLGHPGAVRVDDVDTAEDGSIFLVMELLDGETLADRVSRQGVASLDEALRWADELLDVLGAAHAIGIVHRDVKPDNVFLTRDGRVKLLDFGIARMRDGQGDLRTATGVAIGTLPYMPPEQARGLAIDARADVFALGATLVRVIAGRTVHDAGSDAELFLKVASEPAPPAERLAPHLAADACAVLDRALAFDREQRYPDAASMQADVRALREGRRPAAALQPAIAGAVAGTPARTAADARPAVTTPGMPPHASAPPARSATARRPLVGWVLGGSIGAGVLLAAVVLTMLRSDGEPDLGPAEAGGAALAPAAAAPAGGSPGVGEPGASVAPGAAAPTPGSRLATTGRGATPPSPPPPGMTSPAPPPAAPGPAGPGAQPTSPPSSSPPPPPAPRKPDDDDDDRKDREKDRKSREKERDKKKKGKGKDDD